MNLSVASQIARARIQKTIVFAESVREVQYAGPSDGKVSLSWTPGKHLCGKDYLLQMTIPNVYFQRGDCVRHPAPQWKRHRQNGSSRSCEFGSMPDPLCRLHKTVGLSCHPRARK